MAISDAKKFKILQKDLIIGVKTARTLQELIALLERKLKEYS